MVTNFKASPSFPKRHQKHPNPTKQIERSKPPFLIPCPSSSSHLTMPLSPTSSLLLCPETPDDVTSDPFSTPDDVTDAAEADSLIADLLASELHHMPNPNFAVSVSRHNAVNWILNVSKIYRFSPLTAYLAVNYLDRFLSQNTLQGQNGENREWPLQLLSVACVSVAAKMNETHVPLLLDLQILDPKFVFGPETVTRMELLLMTSLKWRMRSVTPFDYVNRFVDLIVGDELITGSRKELISHVHELLVTTCRVVDFLKYRPSEIATATVIYVMKGITDLTNVLWRLNEWVSEKNVIACIHLMEASLTNTCPNCFGGKRQSPDGGGLDVAVCYDSSQNRSSATSILTSNFEDSRLQPPKKRLRFDHGQCIG